MVDMNMSMSDEAMTDYSSFEYQSVEAIANMTPDDTLSGSINPQADFLFNVDPLDSIGGLQNNEVAELVYLETQASVEPEDEQQAQQTVTTAVEHRGVVGANLTTPGGLADFAGPLTDTEVGDTRETSLVNLFGNQTSRDEIFQLYMSRCIPPATGINTDVPDSYSASNGGSLNGGVTYEKNFRQLTGRGPVLDNTDDITISGSIIGGDLIEAVIGNVRLHMVWDVAETDDAGRAFSVPR